MRLKRVLWGTAAVLLAMVALAGVGVYRLVAPLKPTVEGEVLGSSTAVLDGYSQVFVINSGRRAVILIDAGMDKEATAVRQALVSRNMGPDAVQAILLTHGHPDHIGGVGMFPNAEVYAHREELDLLGGRVAADSPVARLMPRSKVNVRVTHPVEDGQVIRIGDKEIEVFHLPGHTEGSVAYLVDGLLYLGDSASGTKVGTVIPAPWIFSDDTRRNRRSLVKLAERLKGKEVRGLVFAHSGAIDDPQALQRLASELSR
ncbi:MAG: MBL fold metallo-hydrolase [Myxococcota bacterium]|nr:MBL fold metallo-hydrolase [Myxococcota bacterium]